MNHSLLHRGPDAHAAMIRRGVALGHTRLSIIDQHTGQQPMLSEDKRFCITYNGEIYNYKSLRSKLLSRGARFTTESDTEVILQLYQHYGSQCLEHLQGMFCFVIHDNYTGEIFIARDRLGIKPLFYYHDDKVLLAASEIKAIFASGLVEPKLCIASIKNYFQYQFSICPNTLFESIFELPPGHYMSVNPGGQLNIVRYWDVEFPKHHEFETHSESYWMQEFESVIEKAVYSHTVGDTDIGAYLSGGIDSCSITSLLTQNYIKPLQTFSIGFKDNMLDESSEYKAVAQHLNVPNKDIIIEEQREGGYIDLLRDCLYHLEQPQRMAVDIPHFLLSELVQKHHYKVVYTGDGADEILAGYDCFRQDSIRSDSNNLFGSLTRRYRYMHKYTKYFSKDHMRMLLKLHKRSRQKSTIRRFGFYPAWFDFWSITSDLANNIFTDDVENNVIAGQQMDVLLTGMKNKLESRHPLNQSLYFETKTRLPGWILWKSDRLSMAHGVEARVPFMDHHLVELAARLPPELKLKGMEEKYILKKTMAHRLPVLNNRFKKRGFYTPIREWFFTAERYEQIEPYLCSQSIERTKIFDPARVSTLYQQLLKKSTPTNMDEYYQTMRLEWVLLLVLTVQILHDQFIDKQAKCFQKSPFSSPSEKKHPATMCQTET